MTGSPREKPPSAKSGALAKPGPRRRAAPGRREMLARLWAGADEHLRDIESQIAAGDMSGTGRDLASLAKVLRDLAALDAGTPPAASLPNAGALRGKILQRLLRLRESDASDALSA